MDGSYPTVLQNLIKQLNKSLAWINRRWNFLALPRSWRITKTTEDYKSSQNPNFEGYFR
jgi:bacterioferritin (cytochrome b1)